MNEKISFAPPPDRDGSHFEKSFLKLLKTTPEAVIKFRKTRLKPEAVGAFDLLSQREKEEVVATDSLPNSKIDRLVEAAKRKGPGVRVNPEEMDRIREKLNHLFWFTGDPRYVKWEAKKDSTSMDNDIVDME